MNGNDIEPSDSAHALTPPSRPRVFARVFVGIVLVIGMAAGYIAMGRQKTAKQAEAIDALVQAGGRVYFDYQWHAGEPVPDAVPPQAAWVGLLVGDAKLNRAVAVDLRGVEQPDALARPLLILPYLRHIHAADTASRTHRWPSGDGCPVLPDWTCRVPRSRTLPSRRGVLGDLARLSRLARLDLNDTACPQRRPRLASARSYPPAKQ